MEAVYNVDSYSTMESLAQAMGFWDAPHSDIEDAGRVASGGSYFLNHVGRVYQPTGETMVDEYGNTVPIMAALSGEWGRLRINGQSTFLTSLKAVVAQTQAPLTIYEWSDGLGAFSSDGITPAPEYVSAIGLIL